MTSHDQTTFDPRIADWLEDDPNNAPDQALDIVLAAFPSIKQRHASRLSRRFTMTTLPRLALGAAAIVVVVLGGMLLLRPPASGVVGGGSTPTPAASPTPTATPTPTPSPTPAATPPSTVGWLPFTSSHYGYSIAYPPTWAATQATRAWDFAKDRLRLPESAPGGVWDVLLGNPPNGPETAVLGFAADVPAGTSEDAWLASYYAGGSFCPTMPTFVPITVDGHAGRLDPCYDAQAFVFVGHRVYVFVIFQTQMQPLFNAFLSTVKFQASTPSGSPGASASP